MTAPAFLLLVAAFAGQPTKVDPAEQAIRKVLDDQARDWNKRDLEGFMAGYWKSPEMTFISGGKLTKGWDATLERFRLRYKAEGKEMGTLAFTEVQVQMLAADSAFVRGRFDLVLGKDKPSSGRFTLIVRKLADGWRIVHDHTSSD